MGIGTSVRMGLKKAGLTQQQLADLIGVKRETVSTWCNGHYKPHYESVELMAAEFGVKVSVMIEWGE